MNFGTDILDQFKTLPHWVMLMVGMTVFAVVWRKNKTLPNWPLPILNMLLPAVVYPLIHYSPEFDKVYFHPIATLAVHGLGIGIVSDFAHSGIVARLKKLLPSFDWPEDAPKDGPPAEPKKDLPTNPDLTKTQP